MNIFFGFPTRVELQHFKTRHVTTHVYKHIGEEIAW